MNKHTRIVASSTLFVVGAILIGYGFTAIDFSFSDDRWSRTEDRTSHFPLIGAMETPAAFALGMVALAVGLLTLIIASFLTVVNYSSVKNLPFMIGGVLLIAWGLWGIAFSFNTIEWRIQHGIDRVEIPCLDFCAFSSEEWLFINFGMMSLGLAMAAIASWKSRMYTKHTAV